VDLAFQEINCLKPLPRRRGLLALKEILHLCGSVLIKKKTDRRGFPGSDDALLGGDVRHEIT
jgi:hypothetical protein